MSLPLKVPPIPTLSKHRKDAEVEAWICNRLEALHVYDGARTHAPYVIVSVEPA